MVEKKIREIVIEHMDLSVDYDLSPDLSFKDDIKMDSVDVIEIIMALENEFEIEIPDEELARFKTFGDLVNYIKEQVDED